jgi:2-keto-4-pentenoate hydratase/2-oxohepta-3-ene-1,7-dioic acid hydratase in catechol pathway
VKFASVRSRASIVIEPGLALDLERASSGTFSHDPAEAYANWDEIVAWTASHADASLAEPFAESDLGNPVPAPKQVFAIGLNYAKHAAEGGFEVPTSPAVFTKFVSCLSGPYTTVNLPVDGKTDWEVELVVVIGKKARRVLAADAFDYVAGYTVGQAISERHTQRLGPAPQYSMAKSFEGFGPLGPQVVTVDEFADRNALELGCTVNGEQMQSSSTSDLVFPVAELIEYLSNIATLYPGDIIFTGTPSGVGSGRNPRVFLKAGDVLESTIEGIGTIRQNFR